MQTSMFLMVSGAENMQRLMKTALFRSKKKTNILNKGCNFT